MSNPPTPNPIMSSEYGMTASARATPNSACTAGSTTGTMYMPHAPIVVSASVTTRRAAAYVESVCDDALGDSGEAIAMLLHVHHGAGGAAQTRS